MNLLNKYGAILTLAFGTIATAEAAVITDQLYNTGLDGSGNLVASTGGTDGNWDVNPGADAITYVHPAYAANDTDSQWISSNASGGSETTSLTSYVFSTSFDLTGYDAATAVITGLWGVDNYASIFLNGNDTGVALSFGGLAFQSLHSFSISDFFVNGINTLSVSVTNGYPGNPSAEPGPMALRFDDMELNAEVATTPVPEPGTLVLLGLGLAGLGFSRRLQS